MKRRACVLLLLVTFSAAAQAVELQLPVGAQQTVARDTVQDRYFAPIAPFLDGIVPAQMIEGAVARSVWRIEGSAITPLQLIAPLRAQLDAAGFRIVLDCAAQACGGYDFRFATEVLPAPSMYVNIRDYHVITAVRGPQDAPEQTVTILASASSGASFIQIIQAGADVVTAAQAGVDVPEVEEAGPVAAVQADDMYATLLRDGHVVLGGLDFESGTSDLGAGPFAALEMLAQVMQAEPDIRLALVGHTDNTGSLEANIGLSRSRANAVRARLIEVYGIAVARLEAQGMGYLAPYTTNATPEGREMNRRVEAVVLAD